MTNPLIETEEVRGRRPRTADGRQQIADCPQIKTSETSAGPASLITEQQ